MKINIENYDFDKVEFEIEGTIFTAEVKNEPTVLPGRYDIDPTKHYSPELVRGCDIKNVMRLDEENDVYIPVSNEELIRKMEDALNYYFIENCEQDV
jgi:hypothetical protein